MTYLVDPLRLRRAVAKWPPSLTVTSIGSSCPSRTNSAGSSLRSTPFRARNMALLPVSDGPMRTVSPSTSMSNSAQLWKFLPLRFKSLDPPKEYPVAAVSSHSDPQPGQGLGAGPMSLPSPSCGASSERRHLEQYEPPLPWSVTQWCL